MKIKRKVSLAVYRCNSFAVPNAKSFQREFPDYKDNNSSIYVNDHRVCGGSDYDKTCLFDTKRCGIAGMDTIELLRALNIPNEIINQLEFE